MEVFRPLDGLAAEVAAHSPPLAEWRKFVYCESLTGRLFGEVDHFQVGPLSCSVMLVLVTLLLTDCRSAAASAVVVLLLLML